VPENFPNPRDLVIMMDSQKEARRASEFRGLRHLRFRAVPELTGLVKSNSTAGQLLDIANEMIEIVSN
jgi:hypothetical protein